MQTQKWVDIALLFAAAVIFLFISVLVGFLWNLARLPLPEEWPVGPAYMIGFAMAAVGAVWIRKNQVTNSYLNEVVLELARVTWPNRKETVASAGVVIVLIGIAALLLFVIDSLWGTIVRGLLTF